MIRKIDLLNPHAKATLQKSLDASQRDASHSVLTRVKSWFSKHSIQNLENCELHAGEKHVSEQQLWCLF